MHTLPTPTIDTDGAKIEAMLVPLIEEHGATIVREHLSTLFKGSKWSDYQRVLNFINNIERRLQS